MEHQNLIEETPNQDVEPRAYIQTLWEKCDHEPHFFTYLMQTLHFLANEFPLLPETNHNLIENVVQMTTPQTGEFYSSYMATMPDNPFAVCFGVRVTTDKKVLFTWFNIVCVGNKIYAFNPCRLAAENEDSVLYLGITIPTLMITENYLQCRTVWDMLQIYIKKYEDVLPFITPEQAAKMEDERRAQEIDHLRTIMGCVGDYINALPIERREDAINDWNAAQRYY